jgi:hypothetical protein
MTFHGLDELVYRISRTFPFNDGFFTRFNWDLFACQYLCAQTLDISTACHLFRHLLTGLVVTSELLYDT